MSHNPEPDSLYLEYIGPGFVPGVPARNLSKADVDMLGIKEDELVQSGMYRKAGKPKGSTNKQASGPSENKGA